MGFVCLTFGRYVRRSDREGRGLKQGTLAAVLGIVALPSLVIFRGSDGHIVTKEGRLDVNVRACRDVQRHSMQHQIHGNLQLRQCAVPRAAPTSILLRASVLIECISLQPNLSPLEIYSRWKTSAITSSQALASSVIQC